MIAKENRLVFDLLAESFCDESSIVHFCFWKKRQEFFAAVASENIVLAQQTADSARNGLEHGIARGMAVGIVDILEMVDVDKDDAERLSGTVGTFHFFFDGLVHVATVRQLREFIRSRNDIQLLIRLFKLVSTFFDFFFEQIPVFVQFFNLPFDSRVHLVEHFGESPDFVLTSLGLEFLDVEVSFCNLRNVINQVVQWLTDNQNLPKGH